MLDEILKKEDCAKCKECCKFTKDNIEDAPLFTKKQMLFSKFLLEKEINFIKKEKLYQITLVDFNVKYKVCPLLDNNTGCRIASEKPLDCSLWPFYVARTIYDSYVICLSKDCFSMSSKDIGDIMNFLEKKLEDLLITYAKTQPESIVKFDDLKHIFIKTIIL